MTEEDVRGSASHRVVSKEGGPIGIKEERVVVGTELGEQRIPLAGLRKIIADRMSYSHADIPPAVGMGFANVSRLFAVRPMPPRDAPEIAETAAFRAWVAERSAARDRDALLDYRRAAPHGAAMHPTDEHWLPFYIAAGAGGMNDAPVRLHEGVTYGSLAMDAYAFGGGADALAKAVLR